MQPHYEDDRVTTQQAIRRFRANTIAELKTLNSHLPPTLWLRRSEIEHLADELLHAFCEQSAWRNASLFGRMARTARRFLIRGVPKGGIPQEAEQEVDRWHHVAAGVRGGDEGGPERAPAAPCRRDIASARTRTTDIAGKSRGA